MPRPRFQNAPVEKREAVLDAAANEFATHGYDNASVNRILLAAGFSKGSFYYYFDDKLDLAAAVLEREAARFMAVWSELKTPHTPEEFWSEGARLIALSRAQLRKAPHSTTDALLRLGTAMSRHPELMARLCTSGINEATSKIAAYWKQGQDVGAVRTDLPTATLIALMQDMKMVLVRLLLPHDRAPSNEELETFSRVYVDMIRRATEVPK